MINYSSLYLEHTTKRIMEALQSLPGKLYLGDLPIKDKAAAPAIQMRLRFAIERKLISSE